LGTFLLFLNKNQSIPLPIPSASPEVNAVPNQETTIIERSIEKVKDVVPSTMPQIEIPQQSPSNPFLSLRQPLLHPVRFNPHQRGNPIQHPPPYPPKQPPQLPQGINSGNL
jgi:hypothetical protein